MPVEGHARGGVVPVPALGQQPVLPTVRAPGVRVYGVGLRHTAGHASACKFTTVEHERSAYKLVQSHLAEGLEGGEHWVAVSFVVEELEAQMVCAVVRNFHVQIAVALPRIGIEIASRSAGCAATTRPSAAWGRIVR